MIVMDDSDCMVDIAKFYLKFCVDESCGKCAPCRIGGWQLLHILEGIAAGRGTIIAAQETQCSSKFIYPIEG